MKTFSDFFKLEWIKDLPQNEIGVAFLIIIFLGTIVFGFFSKENARVKFIAITIYTLVCLSIFYLVDKPTSNPNVDTDGQSSQQGHFLFIPGAHSLGASIFVHEKYYQLVNPGVSSENLDKGVTYKILYSTSSDENYNYPPGGQEGYLNNFEVPVTISFSQQPKNPGPISTPISNWGGLFPDKCPYKYGDTQGKLMWQTELVQQCPHYDLSERDPVKLRAAIICQRKAQEEFDQMIAREILLGLFLKTKTNNQTDINNYQTYEFDEKGQWALQLLGTPAPGMPRDGSIPVSF